MAVWDDSGKFGLPLIMKNNVMLDRAEILHCYITADHLRTPQRVVTRVCEVQRPWHYLFTRHWI